MKEWDIYLASKIVQYKPYNDLQSLPIFTHHWKDLLIDFVMGLLILIDWKRDNYDLILVIINWLIKMVHYKLVKVIINALGRAKVIINVVVRHDGLLDSIVTNQGFFFTSKLWLSLCYFLNIKQIFSIAFYP